MAQVDSDQFSVADSTTDRLTSIGQCACPVNSRNGSSVHPYMIPVNVTS